MPARASFGFPRSVFIAVLAIVLTGCGNTPRDFGDFRPDAERHASLTETLVATTRAPARAELMFSDRRAEGLNFGSITVSVPPIHVPGQLERSLSRPDPKKHFAAVRGAYINTEAAFIAAVNRQIADNPSYGGEVMIFVHGYNTSFAEGVFRGTQFHNDWKLPAVPVHFSWPSAANAAGYVYDKESVLYSRDGFARFLEVMGKTNAKNIVVLAHSMGTHLTMETLRQLAISGRRDVLAHLDMVALISPDIDRGVFDRQFEAIAPPPFPMVAVVSRDDRALAVSARLQRDSRLGSGETKQDLIDKGIAVVDLTDVNDGDGTNHSKFATSATFIQLIQNRSLSRSIINAGDREEPSAELDLGLIKIEGADGQVKIGGGLLVNPLLEAATR
ncbi:MAG: alpha/beta hydrolase [Pseudomonadota bacterium]